MWPCHLYLSASAGHWVLNVGCEYTGPPEYNGWTVHQETTQVRQYTSIHLYLTTFSKLTPVLQYILYWHYLTLTNKPV